MRTKFRAFEADEPVKARLAACRWLADFSDHGPLDIIAIRVTGDRDLFTATVTYTEMPVDLPVPAPSEEQAALRMIA
jgi:hypothetical protein